MKQYTREELKITDNTQYVMVHTPMDFNVLMDCLTIETDCIWESSKCKPNDLIIDDKYFPIVIKINNLEHSISWDTITEIKRMSFKITTNTQRREFLYNIFSDDKAWKMRITLMSDEAIKEEFKNGIKKGLWDDEGTLLNKTAFSTDRS